MVDEVTRGLERLKEIFEARRILRVSEVTPLRNRYSYILTVSAYEKTWEFTASRETLSDLPEMKAWQQSADRLARVLEGRFRNVSPDLFFCISNRVVLVKSEWPAEPLPNRAASYIRTNVVDARNGQVAKCFVTITHQQSIFDLKQDPFHVFEALVNSVRGSIDAGTIAFHPEEAHPLELQEVKLSLAQRQPAKDVVMESFLRGKVFWLAFKQDSSSRAVWVSDPWDAAYLGVWPKELIQAAEILAAQEEIKFQEGTEFASIGRQLLARARDFERGAMSPKPHPSDIPEWDVFISHAREDKELFVRPLAELLRKHGLRVWFDEFTLTLGDSLRRSIDEGLGKCKFGVVVLSPAFFSKEWPQKELDGLVARESEGQKVVLPLWHNISAAQVRQFSPLLADRFAVSSSQGISEVVDRILEAISSRSSER